MSLCKNFHVAVLQTTGKNKLAHRHEALWITCAFRAILRLVEPVVVYCFDSIQSMKVECQIYLPFIYYIYAYIRVSKNCSDTDNYRKCLVFLLSGLSKVLICSPNQERSDNRYVSLQGRTYSECWIENKSQIPVTINRSLYNLWRKKKTSITNIQVLYSATEEGENVGIAQCPDLETAVHFSRCYFPFC